MTPIIKAMVVWDKALGRIVLSNNRHKAQDLGKIKTLKPSLAVCYKKIGFSIY